MRTILKSFTLEKVHGHKNLHMDFSGKGSVLLAPNGSGKTTLLNALYALLTGKLERIYSLQFEKAVLNFNGVEIVFLKQAAFKSEKIINEGEVENDDEVNVVKDFVLKTLLPSFYTHLKFELDAQNYFSEMLTDHEFRAEIREKGMSIMNIRRAIEEIYEDKIGIDYIKKFNKEIAAQMSNVEVLYLPTYRRIEAKFSEVYIKEERSYTVPRHQRKKLNVEELMYFGMSDVKASLERILGEIKSLTLGSYAAFIENIYKNIISEEKNWWIHRVLTRKKFISFLIV